MKFLLNLRVHLSGDCWQPAKSTRNWSTAISFQVYPLNIWSTWIVEEKCWFCFKRHAFPFNLSHSISHYLVLRWASDDHVAERHCSWKVLSKLLNRKWFNWISDSFNCLVLFAEQILLRTSEETPQWQHPTLQVPKVFTLNSLSLPPVIYRPCSWRIIELLPTISSNFLRSSKWSSTLLPTIYYPQMPMWRIHWK